MTLSRDSARGKTLQTASALLNSLQPQIEATLGGEPLSVGLESMHVMNVSQAGDAHVLWMGPDVTNPSTATKRLTAVCDLIHTTFRNHSFVVEDRPLKLHCTILNTSHRRQAGRRHREPFSYTSVLRSRAMASISTAPLPSVLPTDAVPVTMGEWTVNAVQICSMGSHGPDNEYVSFYDLKI